ncbi:hypothetical protein Plhal304r1_c008g0031361 [Plasmopara halstedii]
MLPGSCSGSHISTRHCSSGQVTQLNHDNALKLQDLQTQPIKANFAAQKL